MGGPLTAWRVALVAALVLLAGVAVWRLAAPPIPRGLVVHAAGRGPEAVIMTIIGRPSCARSP